jgi:type II secretory pathway pseudopilin PulG
MIKKIFNNTGSLLVEVLIVMGLMGLLLPALISAVVTTKQGEVQREKRIQATGLLREAMEAIRVVREDDWQTFATAGTYHPVVNGSTWQLAAGPETINGLTRQVIIGNVSRDATGKIASGSATIDPSTKKITISVGWTQPTTGHVESVEYLTRYLDNLSITETTEADFNPGTKNGTAVVNDEGGEVILSSGGKGNWCKPNEHIQAQFDLPQSARARVVKAIQGKAFTGTDGSGGVFVELGISQDDPPQVTVASTVAGYDTKDIFIDNNYAYIATGDTSKDVVIVDLNTNQEVGYFNDTFWWGSAQGVFVKGNVGYVTIGPKLHTFDLSSKTGSRPELDSVELSPYWWFPATGYRLQVVGNYAYVALDFGSAELQLINVTNPSNISRAGSADVNSERGEDLVVNETGTRAYLLTEISSNKREMFIINTQNKTGTLPKVGEYDTNGMDPRGLALVTENKLIIVGTGGEEYQVVTIAQESSPQRCGGLELETGVYGVSGVLESDGEAFSYIVTRDTNSEFKVIEGGAGDAFASSGTFESKTLSTAYPTAFNYSISDFTKPNQTSAQYQVAVADPVNGNCTNANFVYVGPSGTSSDFFTSEGAIPLNDDGVGYENPGQCFRYKVFLSTADSSSTPLVNSMIVNYSP